MTYEQKMAALNAISECAIKMRTPGNWFLSQSGVEVKDGPLLRGTTTRSTTPEDAINEYWQEVTALPHGQYLVVGAYRDTRRAVRWNGYMWEDVKEEGIRLETL